ncbi:MAG: RnfABCDGE type electron transport complex subunit D [Bacilli bacterium]
MTGYIHEFKSNKKTFFCYIIAIIPLILYGIYKNGILVYQKDLIGLGGIFKILLIPLISVLVYELICFIIHKKFTFDSGLIDVLIVSLFVMPTINIFLYAGFLALGILLIHFISKKVTFNKMCFLKLFIVLGVILISKYSYLNLAEARFDYSFRAIDLLFGREVGGVFATNIFLGIASFIGFSLSTSYKKIIPVISYIVYFIILLVVMIISKNYDLTILFNANVILAFIFVGADSLSTPYTNKGLLIYSVCLGILTVIFSILTNYFEGVFIAILLLSFIYKSFDLIKLKKA